MFNRLVDTRGNVIRKVVESRIEPWANTSDSLGWHQCWNVVSCNRHSKLEHVQKVEEIGPKLVKELMRFVNVVTFMLGQMDMVWDLRAMTFAS